MPLTGYANAIRINYQYIIPGLDIRRAKIASITSGTGTIVLTDDTTLTQETENDLTNGWVDYVTIVDIAGTIVDSGRVFSSYTSSTKTLLVTSLSGTTAVAGNYVVFGSNVTTHSALPDICSRYLVEYMALRSEVSDTSSEAPNVNAVLTGIEKEILDSIESLEDDMSSIAILDQQFLNYSDDTDY
jgi:hypothetical protein